MASLPGINPSIPSPSWTRDRDDYGRSCHTLRNGAMRTVGVVVKLPAGFVEKFGVERAYLCNDWTNDDRDAAVTYHPTLGEAKAHLVAVGVRRCVRCDAAISSSGHHHGTGTLACPDRLLNIR